MKTIEHLDKYVVTPNVEFYGGFIYDGEDIFLCDDVDKEEDYYCRVKQVIENNILYTELQREYDFKGKKVKETSNMEVEIEKGQLLVYIVGAGYQIPERAMCKVEEAIGYFEILRGVNNDEFGNEAESSQND